MIHEAALGFVANAEAVLDSKADLTAPRSFLVYADLILPSKPISTQINFAHPLAKGLIFAFTFAGDSPNGPVHDLVHNVPYTPAGNPPYLSGSGPYGGFFTRRRINAPDLDFPFGIGTVAVVLAIGSATAPFVPIAFLATRTAEGLSLSPYPERIYVGAPFIGDFGSHGGTTLGYGNVGLSAPYPGDGWHHLAYQWGTNLRIFEDGVLKNEGVVVSPRGGGQIKGPWSRGGDLPLYQVDGAGGNGTSFFYSNLINNSMGSNIAYDCLFIWDRELTAAEIASHAADPYQMFGLYGIHIQVRIEPFEGGPVIGVDVTNGGSGYSEDNPPGVRFYGGFRNTTEAPESPDAVAVVENGQVTTIELTQSGRYYNTPPLVEIHGGPGTGAAAVARIKRTIKRVEYYVNGVKLGESTEPPWDFFWVSPTIQLQTMGCAGGVTPASPDVLTATMVSNMGRLSASNSVEVAPPVEG